MLMNSQKIFDLSEARLLLPKLKNMLITANLELDQLAEQLLDANEKCEQTAELVDAAGSSSAADLNDIRQSRGSFERAIDELSSSKEACLECLDKWVERITDTGVILRDIRTGLLDFPAQQGDFPYLLCWKLDEEDISFWHPLNEGFVGRRPLAVLKEYF